MSIPMKKSPSLKTVYWKAMYKSDELLSVAFPKRNALRVNSFLTFFLLLLLAFTGSSKLAAQTTIVGWSSPTKCEYRDPFSYPMNPYADLGIAANVGTSIMLTFGGVSHATMDNGLYLDNNTVIYNNGNEGGTWASGSGTKGWVFSFNSTNLGALKFSGKMAGSTNQFGDGYGPRDFKLQYSLNNSTWNDVSGGTIAAASDNSFEHGNFASISDISLPATCENKAIVYLRMLMTSNTSVGTHTVTNGISIIDDFIVTGGPFVLAPAISIEGNHTIITDGDATPSLTDDTDFGSISLCDGAGSLTRTFTIKNTGNTDLSVSSVTISGTNAADFTVTAAAASSVPVLESTDFQVTFKPSASGIRTATITVNNSDGNKGVYDFAVQGLGVKLSILPVLQTNVSCNGGANGTASVTATGMTPISYDWSPGHPTGDGTSSVTGLTAGTWTCTVTDVNSCSATQNFTITQPGAITITNSQTDVNCNGGSNGSASVTPSGGTPGYTYLWSPSGGTAATATGLSAGVYTCTVTDANGCTATNQFTITQPAAWVISNSQTNVSCNGGSNGSASVSVSGGTPGYTYLWSPSGGTAATATGLSAGAYKCTISDANNCITVQDFTILQPRTMFINLIIKINESCYGGTTGVVSLSVSGGTGTYSYLWSPTGGTAYFAKNLPAGVYTCTVTDENGCSLTSSSYTVTQPTAINTSVGSQTDVSCNGGSNGSASVTPSGGNPGGYTYLWSPSARTTATAIGLTAGNYTCTVTDSRGCTATRSFTITQPDALNVANGSQTDVSCNGGSNGAASVTPSGGTPGYTYLWSPSGGTAATATGLTAGNYTCIVTDSRGCTTTRSFTITQPDALNVANGSQTNVSCNGGSNGSASVSVSGGTGTYTYNWSPSGGTAATATGLTAGNYTCIVTDANSCTAARSFTLTQPGAIKITQNWYTNISCYGGSNGTAGILVSGGTPGYTYHWSPSGGTAAIATGLPVGINICTVTDANGCTATTQFTIAQPASWVISNSQKNVSCNGGSNGSLSVSVSGGTPGYTYLWSPSASTNATTKGLTAGDYTCIVTDANSCTATRSFTVTQPDAITITNSQTNVSCNGGSNGSASVSVSGGTPGYTYLWSPSGGTAATATGLSAGNYTCAATDANGCTAAQSFMITQPDALIVTSSWSQNIFCYGSLTGAGGVRVSGGTPGYTYQWSPSGGTGVDATGLPAGVNTCTVTDANGCTVSAQITIFQTPAYVISNTQTDVSCNGGSNGAISLSVSGSTPGYTYWWSPTGGAASLSYANERLESVTGLTAGTYKCTITDAYGCTTIPNFTITEPTVITTTGSQTDVSCNGGSNGSASVSALGGTGTYTYNWLPSGGTAATASGLSAGYYTCTITDANGCIATRSFNIIQPVAIRLTVTPSSEVICSGNTTDIVLTSVPAGATFSWTAVTSSGSVTGASDNVGSSITQTLYGQGVTTYTVTPALNGCSGIPITVAITVNPLPLKPTSVGINTYTYDGLGKIASTNFVTGETVVWYANSTGGNAIAAPSGTNVGTYSAYAEARNTTTDCVSASRSLITLEITKAVLTATADGKSKTYGDVNPVLTIVYSGFRGADDASILTTPPTASTTATQYSNVGSVPITVTGGVDDNYDFTYTDAALTIGKAVVTATADAKSKTYGDVNPALTFAYSGFRGTDDESVLTTLPTASTTATQYSNVGSVPITVAGGVDDNYDFTYTDAALTIGKAVLTATADTKSKTYGDVNPALTFAYSGFRGTDDENVLTTPPTVSTTATQYSNVGSVPIIVAGGVDDNYDFTYTDATLTIGKAVLTATADAKSKTYGDVNPALTFAYSGFRGTDDASVLTTPPTASTTATQYSNVGSVPIAVAGGADNNYDFTYADAAITIGKAVLTVTADAGQAKVYGGVDPDFTYTVSETLANGNSFTGKLSRSTGENVGSYATNAGTLSAGSNYSITFVSNDFSITAKACSVSDPALTTSKTYDGSTVATVTTGMLSGILIGDKPNVSISAVATYDNRNVGSGKTITVVYQISGSAIGNYTKPVAYTVSNGEIVTKQLTIGNTTITTNKMFDGTTTAVVEAVGALSGVQTVDASNVSVTAEANYNNANAGVSKTITVVYTLDGIGAGNYLAPASLLINKAKISDNILLSTLHSPTAGCEGSGMELSYSVISGTPFQYQITFGAAALSAGFQNISYTDLASSGNNGSVSIAVPSGIPYGTYQASLQMRNELGLISDAYVFQFVINVSSDYIIAKFDDVVLCDNTANSFTDYQWYKNGSAINGATKQFYNDPKGLVGTYSLKIKTISGQELFSCSKVLNTPIASKVTVSVYPNPMKANQRSMVKISGLSDDELQGAVMSVYNIQGIRIYSTRKVEQLNSLTLQNLDGIYMGHIITAKGSDYVYRILLVN